MSDEKLTPYHTPAETLQAMQNIIEHSRNDVARLPEHLFVNHILPVLTDRSGHADLTVWLDVAGNGFRPIDVYSPGNGEVLFRVPALYVDQPLPTGAHNRSQVSRIVEEANRRAVQHPAIGQTFLKIHLGNQPVERHVDIEHVRAWNNILKRYGYQPVIELADETQPAENTANAPSASRQLITSVEQDDF